MGNRFMANLHVSLEITCKSRIFKIATRCQNWGSIIFHYVQAKSETDGGSIIFHYVQAKSELKNFKARSWSGGGVNHLSTFDADLRNVSFVLISFMGFPAILSALQPFQMCIYNRK